MTNNAAKLGDGDSDGQRLRVVVVGQTGLESALRRDGRISLVRAATGLDALGELADPLGAIDSKQTLVVIAPEAEPIGPGVEPAQLVAALREIEPSARVTRIGEGQGDESLYDAILTQTASVDDLLAAMDKKPVTPTTPIVVVGSGISPHASVGSAAMVAGNAASAGTTPPTRGGSVDVGGVDLSDAAMVRGVMDGADVLAQGLATIRRRLTDVALVPAGSQMLAAGVATGLVKRGDEVIGVLSSSRATTEQVQRSATWLSAWVTLAHRHAELKQQATIDELTGALNRRAFESYVASAIRQGTANRRSFSLLLLDVDNFKYFNDKYGHEAGDQILTELVRLLTATIRPHDRVCRIGGDELVVVLFDPEGPRDPSSPPLSSAGQIAGRFQKAVCDHRFPKLADEAPGRLTISGGLSTFPWDGRSASELLRSADVRLLQAKREGKDRIVMGPQEQEPPSRSVR